MGNILTARPWLTATTLTLALALGAAGVVTATNSAAPPAPAATATTDPAETGLSKEGAELVDAGVLALENGDMEQAKALFAEAAQVYRQAGDIDGAKMANARADRVDGTDPATDEGYPPVADDVCEEMGPGTHEFDGGLSVTCE